MSEYKSLPFEEAIRLFRQKVNLPTEKWTDLWEGMHGRAFVVAGAMRDELLSDLMDAVDKGIARGTTITEFRKDFDETVKKRGWSYKGARGWRTATIFNTNLRTAYAAGHYKQMTDPDVLRERPWWRYVAVMDSRTRPEHAAWHDTVLPADDPWWETHYPPNGWGCRCAVASMSGSEMESRGLEKSARPVNGAYEWTNPGTGEVMDVPRGIDPGWGYNPGKAAWGRNEALRLMEDQGPWTDLSPWGPGAYGRAERLEGAKPNARPGKPIPRGNGPVALRASLRDALGGDDVGFTDPTGGTVMVTQAIVDHILEKPETRWDGREAFFPFIPELIQDPYEIWVSFAKSEVSGRIGIRKKYIKLLQFEKAKVVGLYAEARNGLWVGEGFFRGDVTALKNLRKGRLLYGKK